MGVNAVAQAALAARRAAIAADLAAYLDTVRAEAPPPPEAVLGELRAALRALGFPLPKQRRGGGGPGGGPPPPRAAAGGSTASRLAALRALYRSLVERLAADASEAPDA